MKLKTPLCCFVLICLFMAFIPSHVLAAQSEQIVQISENKIQTKHGLIETVRVKGQKEFDFFESITIDGKPIYKADEEFLLILHQAINTKDKTVILFENNGSERRYPEQLSLLFIPSLKVITDADFISSDGTMNTSISDDKITIDLGFEEGKQKIAIIDGEKIDIIFKKAAAKVMDDKECKDLYDHISECPDAASNYQNPNCQDPMSFLSTVTRSWVHNAQNKPGFNDVGFNAVCANACQNQALVEYVKFKSYVCSGKNVVVELPKTAQSTTTKTDGMSASTTSSQSPPKILSNGKCEKQLKLSSSAIPPDFIGGEVAICDIVKSFYTNTYKTLKSGVDKMCPADMFSKFEGGKDRVLYLLANDPSFKDDPRSGLLALCADAHKQDSVITETLNEATSNSTLYSVGMIKTASGSCSSGLVEQVGKTGTTYTLVGSGSCADVYFGGDENTFHPVQHPNNPLVGDYIKSQYGYTGIYPKDFIYKQQSYPFIKAQAETDAEFAAPQKAQSNATQSIIGKWQCTTKNLISGNISNEYFEFLENGALMIIEDGSVMRGFYKKTGDTSYYLQPGTLQISMTVNSISTQNMDLLWVTNNGAKRSSSCDRAAKQ